MKNIEKSNQSVEFRIEKLEGRHRKIFAAVQISRSLDQVWQVITDYETFPDFMPIVSMSNRLVLPDGSICLEQHRTKKFMGLNIVARSVFKINEVYQRTVDYVLVEGDFLVFNSQWCIEPCEKAARLPCVNLTWRISVLPKKIYPVSLIENVLKQDIPASLAAIRERVETLF
jgi:ribosome-associated toxin RatA of RatAB toxin-antitoxin module